MRALFEAQYHKVLSSVAAKDFGIPFRTFRTARISSLRSHVVSAQPSS